MKRAQKIIALLLAVLIALPTLLTTLSSCELPFGSGDGGKVEGEGGKGDDDGEEDDGDDDSSTKAEYKLTLKNKGGIVLPNVSVYLHVKNNGEYEFKEFLTTDSNGVARITLDTTKEYAYQPDIEGYITEDYYPVVSANQVIELESQVRTDESILGKELTLGSVMYDFEVTTTDGEKFKVSEMLKTHDAVVLNFWYANCDPCQQEFPFMNEVIGEDAYKDKIALLALSYHDTEDEIKTFKTQLGLDNIPMAYERPYAGGADVQAGEISSAFKVNNFPTTVVIDRYGVVCLIEEGALISARPFRIMFDHFIGDDYNQMLIGSLNDITPREKPDVEMPSSDEISDVLDDGSLGNLTYENDNEDEYSWPFIIGEKDGAACIHPSNDKVVASYAQLFFDVELKAGEAVAFDYFASTELGEDILYVIVNGKDIFSISGESTDWQTCFAYAATLDGTYSVALVYAKSDDKDIGDDTVYIRNLRKVSVNDINSETYIFRYAVDNPDKWGIYQDYATVVYNEDDGYYHVGTENGPILLANLMGYSRFSSTATAYSIALGNDSYKNRVIVYCTYASNSTLPGVCPVTAELMELLKLIAKDGGKSSADWLEFCHYYDAYGTDVQLRDPIKGLASFSADDAILSQRGDSDFPNVITYDRLIVPRGIFKKFTPTESGVYLITSKSSAPVVGWIFKAEGLDDPARPIWYQYTLCNREVINDPDNAYMMAYLEAGVDYYISVAFYEVEALGSLQFRIERLGDAGNGYQLTLASPGPFTFVESQTGVLNAFDKVITRGVSVEYDEAIGYWMEKRTDGKKASYLYADFELCTGIMANNHSLIHVINNGGFDFTCSEDDTTIIAIYNSDDVTEKLEVMQAVRPAATRADACREHLKELWGADYAELSEKYMIEDVFAGVYHGRVPNEKDLEILEYIRQHDGSCKDTDAYLRELWGSDYEDKSDEYKLSDIYKGIYHGMGVDYTDEMMGYIDDIITVGTVLPDGTVIGEGDARIGTVLVDARLAELLQLLMDKYTFRGVENSWRKLCYYDHTFCEETPF